MSKLAKNHRPRLATLASATCDLVNLDCNHAKSRAQILNSVFSTNQNFHPFVSLLCLARNELVGLSVNL